MFVAPFGTYLFEFMSFTLITASMDFQKVVDKALRGAPLAISSSDYVVVFLKKIGDQFEQSELLFVLPEKHNLKLKLSMSQFVNSSVEFFWRHSGPLKISLCSKRATTITDFTVP